jgi:hypothetical protein
MKTLSILSRGKNTNSINGVAENNKAMYATKREDNYILPFNMHQGIRK